METGDESPGQSDPPPRTTPETHTALGSSERPLAGQGGAVTFANPEALNTTADALQRGYTTSHIHKLPVKVYPFYAPFLLHGRCFK